VCPEIQVSTQKQAGDVFPTAISEHPIIVFVNLPLYKITCGPLVLLQDIVTDI